MNATAQSRKALEYACCMSKSLRNRPGIHYATLIGAPTRLFSASRASCAAGNLTVRQQGPLRFRSEHRSPAKRSTCTPLVSFSTDGRAKDSGSKNPRLPMKGFSLSPLVSFSSDDRIKDSDSKNISPGEKRSFVAFQPRFGHHPDLWTKKGLGPFMIVTQVVLEQRRQLSDQPPRDKDKKRKLKRQRIQVPNYGPDADRAVRSLQNARKERARAKTAVNIRRALYGNTLICAAKLGAWLSSGSSSMMSEFVHSVVDCGNQALLLMGLRDSTNAADRRHPYGYGKSVYFWALVSALGTFFLGAGVSMSHAVGELMEPSLHEVTNEVWGVLVLSFMVDGYVLSKTIRD
eukprot:scaffold23735_cov250-Cylindrotheca_fusiformis.AAC.1